MMPFTEITTTDALKKTHNYREFENLKFSAKSATLLLSTLLIVQMGLNQMISVLVQ